LLIEPFERHSMTFNAHVFGELSVRQHAHNGGSQGRNVSERHK
jgi:hypothetical protein